jgi:hypothetical protein
MRVAFSASLIMQHTRQGRNTRCCSRYNQGDDVIKEEQRYNVLQAAVKKFVQLRSGFEDRCWYMQVGNVAQKASHGTMCCGVG